jgi:hypothetical protein
MTYEWGLAVIPALLLWDRRPELRRTWLPLFAVAWAVLFVSTPLTKVQLALTKQLVATEIAIQLSVPILAIVGLWAERELGRAPEGGGAATALEAPNENAAIRPQDAGTDSG